MRRFTREKEGIMGVDTCTSQVFGMKQQTIEENEADEDSMEECGQPRYIPIRRNSRFYTSMRARKYRKDRLASREGMEIQTQGAGE